ncbi:DNA metabolism protein [Caldicellulosiruptor changbaiensis]|uniref:DNA metabolism protein n=1 Tax=Caldicellulosiruptor changbaiensis TaxID=1222016 RepID=A0A3T0D7U9_9FIRM|nr:TIGR03915 family putative DNA repair protein [Caldicellulosiruptor changbaiensis]AZT90902.1 DNA metabolism protein [Caldicellulosiruptor changbaiensis]
MYNVFLYDGTFEGLLTCIDEILSTHINEDEVVIVEKDKYQPMFFDNPVYVALDKNRSQELRQKVINASDKVTFKKIYYCFLSEAQNKETYIYKYIKLILKHGKKVKYLYHDDVVNFVEKASKNVSREIGKYMGLMRFNEIKGGVLYAQFEPTNDILVPISYFFKERLKSFKWIIHDKKRSKLSIYDTRMIKFLNGMNLNASFSDNENLYQKLWKLYFKTMAIEERKNLKLQRQNMPKKYWKYLIEKN